MTVSRTTRWARNAAVALAVVALVLAAPYAAVAQVVALVSITSALLSQYLPVAVEHRSQNVEHLPFPTPLDRDTLAR